MLLAENGNSRHKHSVGGEAREGARRRRGARRRGSRLGARRRGDVRVCGFGRRARRDAVAPGGRAFLERLESRLARGERVDWARDPRRASFRGLRAGSSLRVSAKPRREPRRRRRERVALRRGRRVLARVFRRVASVRHGAVRVPERGRVRARQPPRAPGPAGVPAGRVGPRARGETIARRNLFARKRTDVKLFRRRSRRSRFFSDTRRRRDVLRGECRKSQNESSSGRARLGGARRDRDRAMGRYARVTLLGIGGVATPPRGSPARPQLRRRLRAQARPRGFVDVRFPEAGQDARVARRPRGHHRGGLRGDGRAVPRQGKARRRRERRRGADHARRRRAVVACDVRRQRRRRVASRGARRRGARRRRGDRRWRPVLRVLRVARGGGLRGGAPVGSALRARRRGGRARPERPDRAQRFRRRLRGAAVPAARRRRATARLLRLAAVVGRRARRARVPRGERGAGDGPDAREEAGRRVARRVPHALAGDGARQGARAARDGRRPNRNRPRRRTRRRANAPVPEGARPHGRVARGHAPRRGGPGEGGRAGGVPEGAAHEAAARPGAARAAREDGGRGI